MAEANSHNLAKARDVYMNTVSAGSSFLFKDAMILVGIDVQLAKTNIYQFKVKAMVDLKMDGIYLDHPPDHQSRLRRFDNLCGILFSIVGRTPPGIAQLMRMAGYPDDQIKAGKEYQQCKRLVDKTKKERSTNPPETSTRYHPDSNTTTSSIPHVLLPEVLLLDECLVLSDEDITSPMTASTNSFSFENSSGSKLEPLPPIHHIRSVHIDSQSSSNTISSSFSSSSSMRKTTVQKQAERKEIQNRRNTEALIHKVASTFYEGVQDGFVELHEFATAEEVADRFNRLVGFEATTGYRLKQAYKEGRCGELPSQVGTTPQLPPEDFDDLCHLFWSMAALDQGNASALRLTIPQEKSLLAEIVNAKILNENKDLPEDQQKQPMNEIKLMERIKIKNSMKQDVTKMDPRVARRVEWCTKRNQWLHYQACEKAFVERGFARPPYDEKERAEKGHVVFFEGQENRYVNGDEMRLTLDGSSEQPGGRPAMTHTAGSIPEGGKSDQTPEDSCTLFMGIIGDEPMPFLVIWPSRASTAESHGRINIKTLGSFHQVKAKYGYKEENYHDCVFAVSQKGSMTNDILQNWLGQQFISYFPDVQDSPGHRVFLKLDTGPGRQTSQFLGRARVEGVEVVPGLPNGTEMGQEMDQLFGPFKQGVYRSRDKLIAFKGKITKEDVGYLIFGGIIHHEDGKEIELENAFEKYMSREHIRAARLKCGYCPATRNALHSPKLRSEIIEDGADSEFSDPFIDVLLEAERINHEAVEKLVARGYKHAVEAKRSANRVTANERLGFGVTTEPNTEERRALLKKARYAGDYFHITGGGGVVNTADMLLALEQKEMAKTVILVEKKKKDLAKFAEIRLEAKKVFLIEYSKWRKSHFQTAIKYKLGPEKAFERGNGISQKKQDELKQWYERDFKGKKGAQNRQRWKRADEANLQRLKRGEVTTMEETAIFGRSLSAQNEFIGTKLLTMSQERYEQLYSYVYANMSEEKRRFNDQSCQLDDSLDASTTSSNEEPDPFSTYDDEVFGDDDTLVEYEEGTQELEVPLLLVNEPSDEDDELSRGNEGPESTVVDKEDSEDSSSGGEFEMVQDSEDEVSVECRRNIDEATISDRIVEIKDILERHERLCNAQDLYNKGENLAFEHFKVLIESRGAKLGRAKKLPTLLKKWENIAEDNIVWEADIESLESELNELSQKMEK
jgi:hypothetical protein